jgi:hypothetical protein
MARLLALILLTFLIGWGSKVKVVESTSREWMGGLQESGYGIDYEVNFITKNGSDELQMEALWVGDLHMKVRVSAFTKGVPVKLKAGVTFKPGADFKMMVVGGDSLRKPYNFKGEGLLMYRYKGKIFYTEISEFKKLEKIIYP